MVIITGLRLALISLLFIVTTTFAQTGIDSNDTPHMNCVLGGQDFNLNSSTRECKKGIGACCRVSSHCGPTFTPVPTLPGLCERYTETPTATPTATP